MKIAIFSDVHGNLSGLEAVLADIEAQGVDQIIFAGDLCLMGPQPAECLDLVRARRLPSVAGNTDGWLLGQGTPPSRLAEPIAWTAEQLSLDQRAWLTRLPFSLRIGPTGRAGDDLLIVHANPTDVNQIIYPSEVDQLARYGEIRQSDAALEPLVMGAKARTVAFGHLHVPNVRVWRRRLLVNVSSVSMPGDSDPRAKYALLTWMNGRWMAEHRRVEVGAAGLIAAFRAARPPHWPDAVAALETDGYYYPQRV